MKLQRPRNSNFTAPRIRGYARHAGAIHISKPSAEVLTMKTASSEKEGKKLDGFQLFGGILSKQ
jgi:hypothetical protein